SFESLEFGYTSRQTQSSSGAPCGPKTARLRRIMRRNALSDIRSRSQLRARRRLVLEYGPYTRNSPKCRVDAKSLADMAAAPKVVQSNTRASGRTRPEA